MTERKFVVIILTFIVPGSFKSVTDYAKSFSVLSKRLYQRKKIDFSYLKKGEERVTIKQMVIQP